MERPNINIPVQPVRLDLFKKMKKNSLTDKEKIVVGFHLFEEGNTVKAIEILASISQTYMNTGLYRDIAKAAVCQLAYQFSQNPKHSEEAEFYLVVYRMTTAITRMDLDFKNSSYFWDIHNFLFSEQ